MSSSEKPSKISKPAFKYLDDTWANFVSWQANIKVGGGLFVQSRIDIQFLINNNNEGSQEIVKRNMEALGMYVKGKNNFGEMMFCRIMDDFEYYLFDVCFRILKNNPNLLKNRENDKYNNEVAVSLNDILDNLDSTESILHMTLSHKLDSIKRNQGGYEGLVRFIEKKITGKKDILRKEDYLKLKKYYSLRCLFTHSGGIIDSQFAKSFPDYRSRIGEKYEIEDENIIDARTAMNLIIVAIDARIKNLLTDDDLIEEGYISSMIKGHSLIEFAENMENKIEELIKEDNTQSKILPSK